MENDHAIRAILSQHGKLGRPAYDICGATDLFTIGLNGQSIANVLIAIEDRFGFKFPQTSLNRRSVGTIDALCDTVAASQVAA